MSIPSDCCTPCPSVQAVNVPGASGLNAFTYTTANFVIPAVGAQVIIQVQSIAALVVGSTVAIYNANPLTGKGPVGTFSVFQALSPAIVSLYFLGLPSDSAPGTTLNANSLVVAVGTPGNNAYTITTNNTTISLIGGSYILPVVNASWAAIGQTIFASDGTNKGTFTVTATGLGTITGTFLGIAGDSTLAFTIGFNALVTPSSNPNAVYPVSVANGGTNATTATNARANLGAAGSGTNNDITSLIGLTTPLPLTQGGTGGTTIADLMAQLPIQSGTTQLSSGTKTINTGITITANSVVLVLLNTPGGTRTSWAGYKVPTPTRVVGGPGVGTIIITAISDTAGTLTSCTDTVDYLIVN